MNGARRIGLFAIANHTLFIVLCALFLVPVWSLIAISVSHEPDITNEGYRLLPAHLDFSAYRHLFAKPNVILGAYRVTVFSSVLGTLLSVAIVSMCAYALSRRDFRYRGFLTFLLFFTMLFHGGLVPTYILMTNYLHLQNTYAALIIPLMGSVWFLLIMRTFLQQLPMELIEAATIDGAGEWTIYARIIVPLSAPVLATIGLLQLLQYWNSWFPALLYINDDKLYPLQYLLQVMLRNMAEVLRNMEMGVSADQLAPLPSESIRMAMSVIVIGPILFVFPFFQKYFTKGMTVGAIK
ncbi:carbohydrate ABC transporter permease [Paenibacillus cymbidii]|uniref:carbohydrate ABC transporter permease n=1 Tax=Paenibacillus cymbidii TaxID=1639034 RepID=UPI0014369690|nr:carbohydrate ABC transporter permease [Paenibacillus cymbidii]